MRPIEWPSLCDETDVWWPSTLHVFSHQCLYRMPQSGSRHLFPNLGVVQGEGIQPFLQGVMKFPSRWRDSVSCHIVGVWPGRAFACQPQPDYIQQLDHSEERASDDKHSWELRFRSSTPQHPAYPNLITVCLATRLITVSAFGHPSLSHRVSPRPQWRAPRVH